MKNYLHLITLSLVCTIASTQESVDIGTIDISDSKNAEFYDINGARQKHLISKEALEALEGVSSTNYFKALELLPSVNVETHDPYNLTVDQNMLRVRGQLGDTFSRLSATIEGVPYGSNVGKSGTGYLVDKENIEGVEFSTGLIAANEGFGMGTTAGSLNLKIAKPKDEAGATLSLGGGTDNYRKIFVRADSGKINDTFSFFISTSAMENAKWKGEGDIKRKNIEGMVTIDLTDNLDIELFGSYNHFERYEYMPLTYEQTQSLGSNYKLDYNTEITGNKFTDALYYDYYKQDFDEYFYYAAANYKMGDTKITIKPYTFGSEGMRHQGDPNKGIVKKMNIEQEAYGVNADFEHPLAGGKLYGGWWYQEMESTPPPNIMKAYKINSDGSLTYASTGMLVDVEKRVSNSPYIGYEKEIGKFYINAGLRYMMFDFPAVTGYNTAGLADLSFEDALAASSGVKTGMEVDASSEKVLLPSLVLEYTFNDSWKIGGGYARNYANPWQGPLWSIYNSNTATFQGAGITLQDLWDELKLETSDNIEFSTQYTQDNFSIKNTLFYGKYKNKQITVYDPNINLSYYKSNAEATSIGAELEATYKIADYASVFASAYYNKFEFDDDILLATDTYLQSKDNQIPDIAKIGAKAGINLTFGDCTLTPIARYVGARYGDAENTEKVDPYLVFDLNLKYAFKKDKIELSLALQNIFDKKYVGVVSNSLDDTRTGSTSYYVGAPFAAVANFVYRY
ncbi:MAG: TonB-dependent receptor [Sulfurovaceae bacterium]